MPCRPWTCRHLAKLGLQQLRGLKDKHLAPLPALAGSLQELSLARCSQLSRGCLGAVAQLTRLTSLSLAGGGSSSS